MALPFDALLSVDPLTERPVLHSVLASHRALDAPHRALGWYDAACKLVGGSAMRLW